MIHLKLGAPRPAGPADPMGRDWVGWTPEQTPQDIYDRNRGVWRFGPQAARERYTAFTALATGRIVAIVENERIEDFGGGLRAVAGRVLGPGHPVHDALIDQPALDHHRQPMTYPDHPVDHQRTCACGCGQAVTGARAFAPGHDQRAIHTRIAAQWGDTLGFIRWYDEQFGAPGSSTAAPGSAQEGIH